MSFSHDILRKAKQHPDKIILAEVHGDTIVNKTNQKFINDVLNIQKNLAFHQIGLFKKVCVVGPNSYQWVALDIAIVSMGAINIPLYYRSEPSELSFILENAKPDLIVYFDEALKHSIESIRPFEVDAIHIDTLFQDNTGDEITLPSIDLDQTATIIYTSGTSGNPKGVCLSHNNINFMLVQTKSRLTQAKHGKNTRDVVFHYLPLCFAGSRMMLWTQLHRGNPIYLSTNLKNLPQEIGTVNPDYYLNVPALLERVKQGVEQALKNKSQFIQKLFGQAKILFLKKISHSLTLTEKCKLFLLDAFVLSSIRKKIGSNLKFLVCGSAPLHTDTQYWFSMLGIPVYQVYGLTETTAIVTMDTPELVQEGWVGIPIDGIEIKKAEDGELLSKGPHIFQGYYKNQEKTDEVIKDGWFHTGDLCEIDTQGRLRILGRMKNVIIPSSGHNIVPEPLEEMLCTLDASIEYACIVGHGKSKVGVIVTGDVTPDGLKKTIDMFNNKQPHYKKMAYYIHSKDGFSQENGLLTANQKLKRAVIEKHYDQEIMNKIQELS